MKVQKLKAKKNQKGLQGRGPPVRTKRRGLPLGLRQNAPKGCGPPVRTKRRGFPLGLRLRLRCPKSCRVRAWPALRPV